nr:MAG TPA: hypothetical protein [Bacteriophage sp.]
MVGVHARVLVVQVNSLTLMTPEVNFSLNM